MTIKDERRIDNYRSKKVCSQPQRTLLTIAKIVVS